MENENLRNMRLGLLLCAVLLLGKVPTASAQDSNIFDSGKGLSGVALPAAPPDAPSIDVATHTPVTYGVIINGDTEERHQLNAEEAAVFMGLHYGIAPANLYSLSTRKVMKSSPGNVARVAKLIQQKIRKEDMLILIYNGPWLLLQ